MESENARMIRELREAIAALVLQEQDPYPTSDLDDARAAVVAKIDAIAKSLGDDAPGMVPITDASGRVIGSVSAAEVAKVYVAGGSYSIGGPGDGDRAPVFFTAR